MKVFCINEVNFGSTGRIMEQIVKAAGVEYRLGVAESRSNRKRVQANQVFIGNRLTRNLGLKLGTLTGCHGLFHWSATGKLVPCGDVDAMEREIRQICRERPYRKEECAMEGQAFDMQLCFRGYAEVYETVTRENRDC